MAVACDGTAYDLIGPVGAPALVLIHGLGLSRDITWRSIAPVLAERYQVLSYDLPGHAQSVPVAGEVTLTCLSEQLIRLMDELGIGQATLIGFSLGGMINRRVAMDHWGRVTSLVILNSPHERDAARQHLMEQAARDSQAGGPAATIDAALERWFTPGFLEARPEVVAEVRQTVLASDPESYAAHRYVLAAGVTELIRPDPPIAHPALVMTCENDSGSTPDMSRAMADEMPNSTVRILPAMRHMGLVEAPDQFAGDLLTFLSHPPVKARTN